MQMPKKQQAAIPADKKKDSGFGDILSQFVGTGDRLSGFSTESFSITPATRLAQEKKAPSPKKKDHKYEELDEIDEDASGIKLDDVTTILGDDDEYDATFDALIETAFIEDEDVSFRNSLIAMGRRYAIQGLEGNPDTSEVTQAFTRQERAIDDLVAEIDKDTVAVNRDIEQMRMSRTKNYKAMADLISARVSFANVKLSAIKELNNIQKTKFDIKSKMDKSAGGGDDGGGMTAAQTIQRLFSVGRKNMVAAVDYDTLSSEEASYGDDDENANRAMTIIHDEAPLPPASTDGEKFIEHEGEGVEYVLDIDSESDQKQIYAVNKHGDVIPDYPLPSNQEQLSFQINELAGEATDQLQRRYRLRRNGEDVNYESFEAGSQ